MIRPYTREDKSELLHLLKLNTPRYFDASEEADFIEYLDNRLEDYFVVEDEGRIVGSGGINYLHNNTEARISWDIIHPDFQGKGIGKKLTLHRINLIKNNPAVAVIVVRTTQLVYRFYEKLGFALEKTEKDFWAEGFDLYQMKIQLKENLLQQIPDTTDTRQAYNIWASQYDSNKNKTRDLEGITLRAVLADLSFNKVLEIGCGTGKNTVWLLQKADHVTAVDISEEMLARAKEKITSEKVSFVQADITEDWTFGSSQFDLVSFSLVLEHIEHLDQIFKKVNDALAPGGMVYIGELHPFKQYTGTKARFDTEEGRHIVPCFDHHVSDFVRGAKRHGLKLVDVNEFFDENERSSVPRILTILLQKGV